MKKIIKVRMGRNRNTIEGLVSIVESIPLCPDGCKIWKGSVHDTGKPHIMLGGKMQYVHRILYYHYFPDKEKNCQLRQECGNKLCCNIDHIKEGRPYQGRKLSIQDIKVIRKNYPKFTAPELARKFKVTSVMIRNILSGMAWSDV